MNHKPSIKDNLTQIESRLINELKACGRAENAARVIAVSKTFSESAIREASVAGQTLFGESYVQEAVAKIEKLKDLNLEWHFIGPIQSNKARAVAEHFDWIHSVDRIKIAERLSSSRPQGTSPLQICLQVNVTGENSKRGCDLKSVYEIASSICNLPNVRLRGLMTIPEEAADEGRVKKTFQHLREIKEDLNSRGFDLDTLSMGMSNDLELGISEGATLVRVGRGIFGDR